MRFFTDLFTPESWAAFLAHGANVSGFAHNQRRAAERVQLGDLLVCYVVRLSRWCGLLRVTSAMYIDDTPIFAKPDPYVHRFRVEPVVALEDLEQAIPIFDDRVWPYLTLTKHIERRASGWAQEANLRSSLRPLSDEDGRFLEQMLKKQAEHATPFPFNETDRARLGQRRAIRTADRTVVVEVPEDEPANTAEASVEGNTTTPRDSHRVQAMLARIGSTMGFRVWVPRGDRQRVLELIPETMHESFLDLLPLNYDDTTLETVEQIDVIWLKNRAISRAFEVEHTTAIYSGLLRMADLLALQPNMNIRLHIVAPAERQEKVLREIRRPVFSLLESGPLYEKCSYLPYEAVEALANMDHLAHMNHSIIEEYSELAEDV